MERATGMALRRELIGLGGVVAVPLGLEIFRRGEVYAKRHGKLKRSG
jgi:hypothetical protein